MSELPVREVAPAHRFDEARLESFLRDRIEAFGAGLRVQQFQGGASNPTFLLTTEGTSGPKLYVVRKKPPGQLLASAGGGGLGTAAVGSLVDVTSGPPSVSVAVSTTRS